MKVWQEAHKLALSIFEATPSFPAELQEAVGLEMEKIAVEVPKCIATGFRRRGSRNKAHYYNIAQSALEGLRYYVILARDLKCQLDVEDLNYRADMVARMLEGLVRSVARNDMMRGGGRGGRGGRGRGRGGRGGQGGQGGHGGREGQGDFPRNEGPGDMDGGFNDPMDSGPPAEAEGNDDYHDEGGSEG